MYSLDDMYFSELRNSHRSKSIRLMLLHHFHWWELRHSDFGRYVISNGKQVLLLISPTPMQLSELMLPTCYNMSLNYLPIQVSSVPSECVFLSSAETDMKRHNHINSVLMETLQMLKFAVKESRLNFTKNWITSQEILLESELDTSVDLLVSLMQESMEDVVDKLIQALAHKSDDHSEGASIVWLLHGHLPVY